MKKLYVVALLFITSIVFTASWFSPFTALGTPKEYNDNAPVQTLDGLCYAPDTLVRVDLSGGEKTLYSALDKIGAREVKSVLLDDGMLLVYAYSPRVCAPDQRLANGDVYNVMAACADDRICLGAPVLSGSY